MSRGIVFIENEFPYLTNSHALLLREDKLELDFSQLLVRQTCKRLMHDSLARESPSQPDSSIRESSFPTGPMSTAAPWPPQVRSFDKPTNFLDFGPSSPPNSFGSGLSSLPVYRLPSYGSFWT